MRVPAEPHTIASDRFTGASHPFVARHCEERHCVRVQGLGCEVQIWYLAGENADARMDDLTAQLVKVWLAGWGPWHHRGLITPFTGQHVLLGAHLLRAANAGQAGAGTLCSPRHVSIW